jgi:hypothetical protein
MNNYINRKKTNTKNSKKNAHRVKEVYNELVDNKLLITFIDDKSFKKKICLNDRKVFFPKGKNFSKTQFYSRPRKQLSKNILTKASKLFTQKRLISSWKKFEKKRTFCRNGKRLAIYWKSAFLLTWITGFSLFSKTSALKIFGRKYIKKQTNINKKKTNQCKLKVAYEQKKLKKNTKRFVNFLYRVKRKDYIDFLSSFYGSTLFKNVNEDVIGYKRSIQAFDRLDFFRSTFRHDVYNQLLKKDDRYVSYNFKYQSIFKIMGNDWVSRRINPWMDSLIFKRDLFSGSVQTFNKYTNFKYATWRHYLRYKNPRREKKNQLYSRYLFLLPSQKSSIIQLNKKARIKKIISKIVLPFYGRLSEKQFRKIVKKNRFRNSSTQNKYDSLLTNLEKRLDVIVFRLNLAPNILWARRMIQTGNIFVTSRGDSKLFAGVQGLKKNSFPLKLKDPKNLYQKNGFKYFAKKYKNFIAPTRNPNFLVNVGDIVQCSSMSLLQSMFKTNKYLFKKPIPRHLLTVKSGVIKWNRFNATYNPKNMWERNFYQPTTAVMLFKPNTNDIYYKDRSNEAFLKWMVL